MSGLIQDVRYALRQLRKSPGFTAVAVVHVGPGDWREYGNFQRRGRRGARAAAAISSRIAWLWFGKTIRVFPAFGIHIRIFKTGSEALSSFQQMAAFREQGVDLTSPGAPSHLKASQISSGFFSTLGAELALGREFTVQENQPGGAPAAVISNHLWRERFGGSPEALGKNVTLDGVSYSIVGVAPPGFRFNVDADVYTPLGQLDPLILNNRGSHDGLFSFARLKPGVSISQSQAEMSTIQERSRSFVSR